MPALPDTPPMRYGTYAASDEGDIVRLPGQAFCRHDPPAVAVGPEPPEFESCVRLFCPKAAEALTIVARLAGTGELIGALLTEDGASDPPDGIDRLSEKFEPIFDILGRLDAEYRSTRAPRPGESLHRFLLGVAESVAGRGYRLAVTEAIRRTGAAVLRDPFLRRTHGVRVDRRARRTQTHGQGVDMTAGSARPPSHRSRDLLLEATPFVTIAVVSSRERKRRQPGLATDGPELVGRRQLVRGIQGSEVHFDLVRGA